jgi:gluconate 2-dehydrogenase gamma chain
MADRREAVKIIGAIGATCAYPFSADELFGQTAAIEKKPQYFSQPDFEVVSIVAEMIIPATDTPGAIAAGVPEYIDMTVGSNVRHQATFSEGLKWLEKRHFLKLDPRARLALLLPLCKAVDQKRIRSTQERFFRTMKSLTADGYFTSKIGMTQCLGYTGHSMLAEYPECTHEH